MPSPRKPTRAPKTKAPRPAPLENAKKANPAQSALTLKERLKGELLALVSAQLEALLRTHQATREGATHEEAKPESDKDTRAIEQSYLARGQAARVEELQASVARIQALPSRPLTEGRPITLGSLVSLEDDDGAKSRVWLATDGGGMKLEGGRVQVVTPKSPLGQALLDRVAGDDLEFATGRVTRALTVTAVE